MTVIRRRIKQAEIHDRWHLHRTVALRENSATARVSHKPSTWGNK